MFRAFIYQINTLILFIKLCFSKDIQWNGTVTLRGIS